jgi:hypothetical protein
MKEVYGGGLLKESPDFYAATLHQFDNDLLTNAQIAIEVEEKSKHIGEFKAGNIKYRLYKEVDNKTICYSLLYIDQPVIALSHTVKEIDRGIESIDIWNSIWTKGLARVFWIPDYIFKHYKFMMSDKLHTKRGKEFWKSLVKESLDKKMDVFVFNTKTKEKTPLTSVDGIEKYYGSNMFHCRFVISKNKEFEL